MKPRRVLVTGSRSWPKVYQRMVSMALAIELDLCAALNQKLIVVHGACPTGVDRFADDWITLRPNLGMTVERHPADWSTGKDAGFRRNEYMVKLGADRCLAFIHDNSRGASHCALKAENAGIQVIRFRINVTGGI